jgi:hypothetical protein
VSQTSSRVSGLGFSFHWLAVERQSTERGEEREKRMCDCIERIDKSLKDQNLQLEQALIVLDNVLCARPIIHTEFIEQSKKKRGQKQPPFFVKYCPFCGEKYVDSFVTVEDQKSN